MALCIKFELTYLMLGPSIIWLYPPPQIFCLTSPHRRRLPPRPAALLHISHLAITVVSEILHFPESSNVLPHLLGSLLQSLSLSQSLPGFHFFLLISETLDLALSYTWFLSVSLSIQSANFSGPVPPFLCTPHCLQQSWYLSFTSNTCWLTERVTDISTLASLPPTLGLLGWYSHESLQAAISAIYMNTSL